MIYYTTISKHYVCPVFDIPITIIGKYRFFDDNQPYLAKYVSCECPIVADLKLPPEKRNKKYSLYHFCKCEDECLANVSFKPQINVLKDGYSQ